VEPHILKTGIVDHCIQHSRQRNGGDKGSVVLHYHNEWCGQLCERCLDRKPEPTTLLQCNHLQRFDMIYDDNGKSSGLPRGMPLVTRMFASSEHAWDPMASSSARSCSKTRTAPRC
jgi:hypothetical protein